MYLPVYCEVCSRASLSPLRPDDLEQPYRCSFCEASARVIPGPTYADSDWLAFSELDAILFDADVNGLRAQTLLAELHSHVDLGTTAEQMLHLLVVKVPELINAKGAWASNAKRSFTMVQTLLVARVRDT